MILISVQLITTVLLLRTLILALPSIYRATFPSLGLISQINTLYSVTHPYSILINFEKDACLCLDNFSNLKVAVENNGLSTFVLYMYRVYIY